MSGYPFVHARYDYGLRKGPVKAFVVHMAEGGNTVAYLANNPPRGVSVHYVIERDGRIVQMLLETHASGSINPTELRTTDDVDGFYGATAAKAVMDDWWRDPNSAVISLEIEGFASAGPNSAQNASLTALVNDVRTRYPAMGLLGHRDFTSTKACPGKLIHWSELGGHGPAQEADVTPAPITDQTPKEVRIPAGANLFDVDGKTILRQSPGSPAWRPSPYEQGNKRAIFSPDPPIVLIAVGPADIRALPAPAADCTAAVKAATDPLKAQITTLTGAVTAATLAGKQAEWDRQNAGATVALLARP